MALPNVGAGVVMVASVRIWGATYSFSIHGHSMFAELHYYVQDRRRDQLQRDTMLAASATAVQKLVRGTIDRRRVDT